MAHFGTYNTDDPTTGNTPLAANASLIIGPIQSGVAKQLVGSVFSDQAGTLHVEQSFDGGAHFDVSDAISVSAGTGTKIETDVLAPVFQLRYVNGGTNQGHFRIFARTLTPGKG